MKRKSVKTAENKRQDSAGAQYSGRQLTPLLKAILNDDLQEVKRIVEQDKKSLYQRSQRYCEMKKMNVDTGPTPATFAVELQHLEIFQFLVSCNRKFIYNPSRFGQAPVIMAIYNDDEPIFDFIVKKDTSTLDVQKGDTPAIIAARSGRDTFVKKIIELKPDQLYDARRCGFLGWFYYTPAMHATYEGHVSTLKLLLEFDQSLIQKDRLAYIAIDYKKYTAFQLMLKIEPALVEDSELFYHAIKFSPIKFATCMYQTR